MRVLLPQPLGPKMHVNRREPNLCETWSSASTPDVPVSQVFDTCETTTSIAIPNALCSPGGDKAVAQSRLFNEPGADPLGFRKELLRVAAMSKFAVAIDDIAVDNYHACIAAFAGADKVRKRPMQHADIWPP